MLALDKGWRGERVQALRLKGKRKKSEKKLKDSLAWANESVLCATLTYLWCLEYT